MIQTQTIPQPVKKKSFIREFRYVLFGGGLLTILVVSYILRLITPTIPQNQSNTWEGVTPGYSSVRDLEKKLGPPIAVKPLENGSELEYQSAFKVDPHQVVTDSAGKILFIQEKVDPEENDVLDNYLKKYEKYDLALYTPKYSDSVKAYVFLKQGLVILAHVADNSVEERWYFKPVTKDQFLSSWGKDLSPNEPSERLTSPE